MKFQQIITDFDDQDAYKFFMQYAVLKHFPMAKVSYALMLRDPSIEFPPGFDALLREQIDGFAGIVCTPEIRENLFRKVPWFDESYAIYLRDYRFAREEVEVKQVGGKLDVTIYGPWHSAILWEVPLLATISELYFRAKGIPDEVELNLPRWDAKFRGFSAMDLAVIEFGTRRRKSKAVQEQVIRRFLSAAPETIRGTSNVMFARQFGIAASGTQAHEWFMFHAARFGVEHANARALENWVETYKGALGIALTDTYTSDNFFQNFNLFHSKLFDGIRQDSGDPVAFTEKAIAHYLSRHIILPNGFIPKTLVFSDAIDSFATITRIEAAVKDRICASYGIGTWLTNDILLPDGTSVKPLNMVIKMTGASPDGISQPVPCFKLTDSEGKRTGKPET